MKNYWNFSDDLKWCIENDFQVYIQPMNLSGNCKIAIRKGGISTHGKSYRYCKESEMALYSKETLGSITYKTQEAANKKLPDVYRNLRQKYGKV